MQTENLLTEFIKSFPPIPFDLNSLRKFSPETFHAFIQNPMHFIPAIKKDLQEIGLDFQPTGTLGQSNITPRKVSSHFINQFVCIKGIITSMTKNRSKLCSSIHYCKTTNEFYKKTYTVNNIVPKEVNGNEISFEYGMSEFVDVQYVQLQENPEDTLSGIPRSVECYLEGFKGRVKPGDRVKFYGVLKSVANEKEISRFKILLMVYNIVVDSVNTFEGDNMVGNNALPNKEKEDSNMVEENLDVINNENIVLEGLCHNFKVPKQEYMNFFEKIKNNPLGFLSGLIAPQIHGHSEIKKALILQLLSGTEMKNRVRKSINILLVGDPSTAKSQILRFISNLTSCIKTTGRGASGVGLTACISHDSKTHEKVLEAGSMVLSDGGMVCIDEFDKMHENDRVALHEAMEQQTVSINKAGISATLNARCAVLAAANPIFGMYKKELSVERNINLEGSLLSRFDLIFICLDENDEEMDERIGMKVLDNHTEKADCDDSMDDNSDFVIEDNERKEVNNEPVNLNERNKNMKVSLRNIKMMKKYIDLCKNLNPVLTKESQDLIVKYYTEIRKKKNNIKITPRFLESLIRLSCAHCKLRLSEEVNENDVKEAIQIIQGSVIRREKEDEERPKKQKLDETLNEIVKKTDNFDEEFIEKVTDALLICKEGLDGPFLYFDEFLRSSGFDQEEVKNVLEYLDKEEIIIFDGKIITFIN